MVSGLRLRNSASQLKIHINAALDELLNDLAERSKVRVGVEIFCFNRNEPKGPGRNVECLKMCKQQPETQQES